MSSRINYYYCLWETYYQMEILWVITRLPIKLLNSGQNLLFNMIILLIGILVSVVV